MDWCERASCRYEDPELFFPVGNGSSGPVLLQTQEAKKVCRRCPVARPCLERALEAGAVEGIWGGTTEAERRAMARRAERRPGEGPPGAPGPY